MPFGAFPGLNQGPPGFQDWLASVAHTMLTGMGSPTNANIAEIPVTFLGAINDFFGNTANDLNPIDGAVEGGAVTTAGNLNLYLPIGMSEFQTPKSTPWAFAFSAILPLADVFTGFGYANKAGNHWLNVASYPAKDATHYVLSLGNPTEAFAATTVTADNALHNFVVTFDGTTVKLFIDNMTTPAATFATLARLTDEPSFLVIFQGSGSTLKVHRAAYSWVGNS